MNTNVKLQEVLLNAAPMSANHKSTDAVAVITFGKWVNCEDLHICSLHTVWTGNDAADATLTVEFSSEVAPADANALADTVTRFTLGAGGGKQGVKYNSDSLGDKWLRVNFAKGTNTMGNITCTLFGKG